MTDCIAAWQVMKQAVRRFNALCSIKSSDKLAACKELAAAASNTSICLEQHQ